MINASDPQTQTYNQIEYSDYSQFAKMVDWLYSRLTSHYFHTTYNNGKYFVFIRSDCNWFKIPDNLMPS